MTDLVAEQQARKSRLAALRQKKEQQEEQQQGGQKRQREDDEDTDGSEKGKLRFRNYNPITDTLSKHKVDETELLDLNKRVPNNNDNQTYLNKDDEDRQEGEEGEEGQQQESHHIPVTITKAVVQVEKEMNEFAAKAIQEEEERLAANRAKNKDDAANAVADLLDLAPKKPNWDLKRDLEKKLVKLEKKTHAALAQLLRKRLMSDGGVPELVAMGGGEKPREDEEDEE